ncbi:hypothetical protein TNCV_1869211 [Trichonephila clavipes]|nr:hypothetical protein TNCV_1869211 [Trichonephila clavipes]
MENFKHVHKTDFEKRYIENNQFNIVSIERERGFQLPLKLFSAELKVQSSSNKSALWPYSGSQVKLVSPALKEPTKTPSREQNQLNRKSP